MARYVLEPGEVEYLKELAAGIRGKQRVEGLLILTDRRLVAQSSKPSPILGWLLGLLTPMHRPIAVDVGPLEMTHQIDRDDFDSVESHGRQMISFHSKGKGYSHISFAVYSMTSFDVWQQRMRQWVAGTLSATPMSEAKLVDR
jgi:hypothetical protein